MINEGFTIIRHICRFVQVLIRKSLCHQPRHRVAVSAVALAPNDGVFEKCAGRVFHLEPQYGFKLNRCMEKICQECEVIFVQKANTRGRFCSLACSAFWHGRIRTQKSIDSYNASPKLCKRCQTPIRYSHRFENKYCTASCGASASNENKSPESRVKQAESLRETLLKKFPKKDRPVSKKYKQKILRENNPHTRVFRHQCIVTGKYFYSRAHYAKYSSEAAMIERKVYRLKCSFKFSPYKYPDMEGYDLLLLYGIYHPVNNPSGVSRDHKFSVAHGWSNGVDPDLMRHPRNCRLMLHQENNRKNTTSCISYEQLLVNTRLWY